MVVLFIVVFICVRCFERLLSLVCNVFNVDELVVLIDWIFVDRLERVFVVCVWLLVNVFNDILEVDMVVCVVLVVVFVFCSLVFNLEILDFSVVIFFLRFVMDLESFLVLVVVELVLFFSLVRWVLIGVRLIDG